MGVNKNSLAKLLKNPLMDRLYVVSTGAGAGIQQALWSVPGCSSFFVGASFTYNPKQTEEFLGFKPGSYCSAETAIDLSMAAYMKACCIEDLSSKPVGLGLTASVATLKAHRGEHRAYAAVTTRDRVLLTEVILPKPTAEDDVGAVRTRDGNTADELGLNLLLASLDVSGNTNIKYRDVTDLARTRFFMRPFFDHGKRLEGISDIANSKTLFPGAFNPPHEGHLYHAYRVDRDTIFNITANPPHKEALSLGDLLRRASYFKEHKVLFTQDDPRYLDKARNFPNTHFVIGTDAMVRLLDPIWYNGKTVLSVLEELHEHSACFAVTERNLDCYDDILNTRVPEEYKSMFYLLPESPYRDVSSTKIREGQVCLTKDRPGQSL